MLSETNSSESVMAETHSHADGGWMTHITMMICFCRPSRVDFRPICVHGGFIGFAGIAILASDSAVAVAISVLVRDFAHFCQCLVRCVPSRIAMDLHRVDALRDGLVFRVATCPIAIHGNGQGATHLPNH